MEVTLIEQKYDWRLEIFGIMSASDMVLYDLLDPTNKFLPVFYYNHKYIKRPAHVATHLEITMLGQFSPIKYKLQDLLGHSLPKNDVLCPYDKCF